MFYDIFKKLCNYNGMTPNRVCKELGFSNSLATYWKQSGATPRVGALRLIAEYLDVSIQVLLGNEPFEPKCIADSHDNIDCISVISEVHDFTHDSFGDIRVAVIDSEPVFVMSDICKALGLSNPTAVADRLDTDEWSKLNLGGLGNVLVVNECGLYRIIMTTRTTGSHEKMNAVKSFQRWIIHDVIPSIRKTGSYSIADQTPSYAIEDPIARARAWADEMERNKKTIEAKSLQIAMQEQQIAELKPKADYTDEILKSTGTVNISQIANDYGMSAQSLNAFLAEHGVQYKQNGQWLLYSKYQSCGYTKSQTIPITLSDGRPDSRMHTQWTAKGRLFINDLLKRNGILPLMERRR